MNNARRKQLQTALELVTDAKDCEQEAFDNLPESLQCSDRGYAMEEAISGMDEAECAIEAAME